MPHYNITEAEFFAKFEFVPNQFDSNVAHDGCMFETYGREFEFVRQQNPLCVWTVLEDDNGYGAIASGYRHVNRLGYLISTKARDSSDDDYWIYYDKYYEDKEDTENGTWPWEDAFSHSGFDGGSNPLMLAMTAEALSAKGYAVAVDSCSFDNVVITSIERDDAEQISDSVKLGYDDPRSYLPAPIIELLDAAFPASGER